MSSKKFNRNPPLPARTWDTKPPKYEVSIWCKGWVILENSHSWGVFFNSYEDAVDIMRSVVDVLSDNPTQGYGKRIQ